MREWLICILHFDFAGRLFMQFSPGWVKTEEKVKCAARHAGMIIN